MGLVMPDQLRQLRADNLIALGEGLAWVLEPEKLTALALLELPKRA